MYIIYKSSCQEIFISRVKFLTVVYLLRFQVEFEARSPEGEDFHGIKRLLQQLFLRSRYTVLHENQCSGSMRFGTVLSDPYRYTIETTVGVK